MEWLFFALIALGLAGVYFSTISFPLFMILTLLLTGLIWLIDFLFFEKRRGAGNKEPTIVEYSKSFFPVILLVFLIRSFVAEPFKIPSGSMMPTLLAGDYILVNKYTYGLRMPLSNKVFFDINQPKRGDVVVFRFPPDPKIDYIKRIVGLPGDRIQYQDKRLIINGTPVEVTAENTDTYQVEDAEVMLAQRLTEQLGEVKHAILVEDMPERFRTESLGEKLVSGEEITVPAGQYYAMGDNRDNSSDSRVWGFVPGDNLIGKAFFIWFNLDNFDRIGSVVH